MRSRHRNISLYQLLLLFCVDTPTQGMNITLILTILSNTPPVLLPTVFNSDILILIQVRVSLFLHMFLKNIRWYILSTTKIIKHREMKTSFKNARLFNNRISINSQQLTLLFFGKVWYWFIYIRTYLLFQTYIRNQNTTPIFILTILKFN